MSLLAGIENSLDADAIVMMDSDLQHPPELIPELLASFRRGFDVVYTVRRDTEDGVYSRKMAGNIFYQLLSRLSQVPINANAADFRLISCRVARILVSGFQERNMFLRGLFSWIGFQQTSVEYIAEKRFAGSQSIHSPKCCSWLWPVSCHSVQVLVFCTGPDVEVTRGSAGCGGLTGRAIGRSHDLTRSQGSGSGNR
jgi:glycosyltransferase involved in cell wall biosynthesis